VRPGKVIYENDGWVTQAIEPTRAGNWIGAYDPGKEEDTAAPYVEIRVRTSIAEPIVEDDERPGGFLLAPGAYLYFGGMATGRMVSGPTKLFELEPSYVREMVYSEQRDN
jgi:hypothetical protein